MKRTHGLSYSPEYRVWRAMINRCHNPNVKKFKDYGARGIAVCDRWRLSFANFISDMGRRPSQQHTLERINNNGPYTSDNCRWATQLEQQNNTRRNVYLDLNGRKVTIAQLARETGRSYSTLKKRLLLGWSVEEIIGGKR